MKTVDRKISDLIPAEYNPRWISDEAFEQLKASIQRFDAVEPIIVNMHADRENIIIGGHQRIKAAKALGMDTFPAVEVELTRDEERELNIRLNKNVGSWQWDELANFFDAEELTEWGFSDEELFGYDEEQEETDYEDEYIGMPEFEAQDEPDQLKIHFQSKEKRKEFYEKFKNDIEFTKKGDTHAWSAWWPKKSLGFQSSDKIYE